MDEEGYSIENTEVQNDTAQTDKVVENTDDTAAVEYSCEGVAENNTQNTVTNRPVTCGWNWGPFMFGWIYGIFNRSWICLITLIPPVAAWLIGRPFPAWIALILSIVCGIVGEQSSYDNYINSKDQFDQKKWKKHQHVWDVIGFVFAILWIVGLAFITGMLLTLANTVFVPVCIPFMW